MNSIIGMLLLCITASGVHAAVAAWQPQKNVEIVIGAQAAGAGDRTARLLQKVLTETGAARSITVVNRPGQGQAAAVAYVNAHPADPHYLLILGSSWVTANITTGTSSTHRDLAPVIKLLNGDLVMFVLADSPFRSVRDIVDGVRKNIGGVSFGISTTAGNSLHIALAELARLGGADPRKLRIVVNPSGSITATQVAGGHVNVGVSSSGSAQPMVSTGKLGLLGTISSQRLPQLPDLPTLREQGYDVVASTWYTVFAPKGTAPIQVAYWEEAIGKAMRQPEARNFVEQNNWTIELTGSKELPVELDNEHARLHAILSELGMAK